jgi:hypothetical protein
MVGIRKPLDVQRQTWDDYLITLDVFDFLGLDAGDLTVTLDIVRRRLRRILLLVHTDKIDAQWTPPAGIDMITVNHLITFLSDGDGLSNLLQQRWGVVLESLLGWRSRWNPDEPDIIFGIPRSPTGFDSNSKKLPLPPK